MLADRRFLAFCCIGLLTLYCFGHLATTLPVFLTSVLHIHASTWGYLFAFNCILVVVFQYQIIYWLRASDPLPLLALAAALFALGIGLVAFAKPGWSLWLLMALCSAGEVLFVPLSSSVVSLLASTAERGRYMGIWSLVWISGQGLAPTVDGIVAHAWQPRAAYDLVLVVGCATVVAYLGFAAIERRSLVAVKNSGT